MSIFGQVWLWSLVAFVVGVLLSWVLLARPAQSRNRVLERQLLDAKNAAATERQASATRTFDRDQNADARSFDGGAGAATQFVGRDDAAARTGRDERDSLGDTGSQRMGFAEAGPRHEDAAGPGAERADFSGAQSGRDSYGGPAGERGGFGDSGSFGAVLSPESLNHESDAERTTYFNAAPQSDADSRLDRPVAPEQAARFDEQYGNAAATGRDSGTRFEPEGSYGASHGGSAESFGGHADGDRAFGGDFGRRQGSHYGDESNVDAGRQYEGADSRAESQTAGEQDERGHEAGERFESWRSSAGESAESRGQQNVGEDAGRAGDETGAHGRRALEEDAGLAGGAAQMDSGQSRHSLPADDAGRSGVDKLPQRIPGGHRLNRDESSVDSSTSMFGGTAGRGEQRDSSGNSLFDDGTSSRGRGSLFEPGALPAEQDTRAETGSNRGAHAAGDPWSQPFSGVGHSAEEPPAYAFSQDVAPEEVADEHAAEATTVLPRRQPRSTPWSSFEPPRPSMRPVERRESAAPSANEGGRSGSLFEPTVQRNDTAGAPAADVEPPTTFQAPASPPPARSKPAASSVPPGPFGPGSAMPRPGGARPAEDFAVKASVTALRYCTEESPQFARMVAEVWFRSAEDAERVGFRPLS